MKLSESLPQRLTAEKVDASINGKHADVRQYIHGPFKDAGECDAVKRRVQEIVNY
jgi:hypothetical protein